MAEALFDLIFRGDIVPGHNIQEVKAGLAQLFKAPPAKIEALFSGAVVPLKRNLDQVTANKYKAALQKVGAQVELRPVASAAPAPKPAAPPAPAAQPSAIAAKPTAAPVEGPAFSLAPVGSVLLDSSESKASATPALDLSAYSVKPMEGDLLEDSEKRQPVSPPVEEVDFDIAPPGSDLLEGYRHEALPLPDIDPDFDIAELGADLIDPADRPSKPAVQVNTDHLSIKGD